MFTGRKSFLLSIFFLNLSTGFAQDSCVNTTLDWGAAQFISELSTGSRWSFT